MQSVLETNDLNEIMNMVSILTTRWNKTPKIPLRDLDLEGLFLLLWWCALVMMQQQRCLAGEWLRHVPQLTGGTACSASSEASGSRPCSSQTLQYAGMPGTATQQAVPATIHKRKQTEAAFCHAAGRSGGARARQVSWM